MFQAAQTGIVRVIETKPLHALDRARWERAMDDTHPLDLYLDWNADDGSSELDLVAIEPNVVPGRAEHIHWKCMSSISTISCAGGCLGCLGCFGCVTTCAACAG